MVAIPVELTYHTQGNDKPRVVLDTNLFVAAYWNKRSASAEIIRAALDSRLIVFHTTQMRKEMSLILRNIRASEYYRQQVQRLLDIGVDVEVPGSLHVISDDPEDDKFLECAQHIGADYLITNDRHLLKLRAFGHTRILTPSEFRRLLSHMF